MSGRVTSALVALICLLIFYAAMSLFAAACRSNIAYHHRMQSAMEAR